MNKLVFLLLLCGGGWWYFVGSRQISEQQVNEFYAVMEHATLSRDPEAICGLLDEEFQTSGTVEMRGKVTESPVQDKQKACESYRQLYAAWAQIGDKMGGMLQLDLRQTINSIEIAPDKKSATVDMNYALDVGGSIMNIRSHSTDVLVRRNGKVLMQRSTGEGSIGSG